MKRPFYLRIARKFLCRRVFAGPFEGMHYTDKSQGSALMPKILGTYELELHSILLDECRRKDLQVVDVGAAEGYYAVGILHLNPEARVVAFETTTHGRNVMQQVANLNGVAERLTIHGECHADFLQTTLSRHRSPLVVMDVEGAEDWLLDPRFVPALIHSRIIVEIHNGLEERIETRYRDSHVIAKIPSREIRSTDFPSVWWRWLAAFFPATAKRLLHERSNRMTWFHMVPR